MVSPAENGDWRALCAGLGVDAEEVGVVADRYRAYARFMVAHGGGMPLDGWFRFYLFEKRSESGYQVGAPVSGCSAQGEASGQSSVENPSAFLQALRCCLAQPTPKPKPAAGPTEPL